MKIVENHLAREDDGKSYHLCDDIVTDLKDTYMGEDATIGEIFRASQKAHGRCTSKVYLDTKDGAKALGWVFEKRKKYEDSKETYIHETWISLYDFHDHILHTKPHFI